MTFFPFRRSVSKKQAKSSNLVSSFIDLEHERKERDKHEQYMRMMTSFVRRIQCPIADLCGLESLIDDIPPGTNIYQYALAMNTCGLLLATMIQNMTLYYSVSSGARHSEEVSHIFTKNMVQTWCDRTTEPRNGYTRVVDICNTELRCQMTIEQGVPISIVGDPLFMKTILYNLLDNAIKFTPSGSVKVDIRAVEIGLKSAIIEISVCDTGIGIPHDCFEKIFEPLVKSHVEYIEGGAGMGLSVCRAICDEMGGSISIISSDDITDYVGSLFRARFRVYLVSTDLLMDPIHLTASYTPPSQTGTFNSLVPFVKNLDSSVHAPTMPIVLVVDDVKLIRKMFCNMFSDLSIVPDIACDGNEAIQMCGKNKYDIIIMDMLMPGINGIEATRKIKSSGRNKETTIISMTASLSAKIEQEGLEVGISKWMTKPVGRDTLYSTLGASMKPKHIAWIKNTCQL